MPSLAGVMIFVLIPYLDMVIRSFRNSILGTFCGIQNYRAIFSSQAFLLAIKNTIRFVATGIPLLIVLSLLLSLMLNRSKNANLLKTAFLFPMAVPTAAVIMIWKLFFYENGLLNMAFMKIGFHAVDWLGSDFSFWVLIFSYLWKNIGYTIVLWMAGMKNISVRILEAAKVDGASGWNCFRYVMLPELRPVFYTIALLSFLNSFKVFREAYLVAGAYPQEKMYLLQHLFNNWFINLEIDQMSAAAVCISAVLAVVVLMLQKAGDGGK